MTRHTVFCAILLIIPYITKSETVILSGTVKKTGGTTGIPDVNVSLTHLQDISTTTNENGLFSLDNSTPVRVNKIRHGAGRFCLKGNVIFFPHAFRNSAAEAAIFSSDGRRTATLRLSTGNDGIRQLSLPELTSGIHIVRIYSSTASYSIALMRIGSVLMLKNGRTAHTGADRLPYATTAAATIVDTLVFEKEGYLTKLVPLESYTQSDMEVFLDSTGGGSCDRQLLQSMVDSYIEAQKAGDPQKMDLAAEVRYIENMDTIDADGTICNKALDIAFHRDFFDCDSCRTFSEVIVTDASHPYVIGMRLRVAGGKITEVDAIVTDDGDWLFDAQNYYDKSTTEDWDTLPPEQRSTREKLIGAANAYGTIFEVPHIDSIPFGTPCARLEGGAYVNDCTVGFPSGDTDHALTDRSFVVDELMGTVNMFCYLDVGATPTSPDSHLLRLVNGKLRYVHALTIWGF